MAYNVFAHQRPKKQRQAHSQEFEDTLTAQSVTLTMWKPTMPELGQAAQRGDSLVEQYITGNPDTGAKPIPFDAIGGQMVTFNEAVYSADPDNIILLTETVIRNAAVLETMQPRYVEERYTAEEFVAFFATWETEDWAKVWAWSQRIAKGVNDPPKNSAGATTKQG